MIDDFCKRLVASHPASVSRWVLSLTAPNTAAPPPSAPWRLLDRELSSEPLRADAVILLPQVPAPILHLEFQTRPDPAMAERMLAYWIRLHQRFHRPIQQVVIHLRPTASPLARIDHLAIGRTRHHFHCLRLWEQDAAPLLADPALLPLAVLARSAEPRPEQLLLRVQQRLQTITDPDQRRRTTTGCQLLAGLTFDPDVIQRLLAMSILEDSSVYQLIVRKGLEEGRQLGMEQGRQEEAARLLLHQLARRCGPLSEAQCASIRALDLQRLEQLADAVLDFHGPADLIAWLG
ncbi:DUF4351 domain-containing protein [Cyanobium sp. FGCU-6]|nr:DUF4351 domain-containing protein [Cyanobium sp. FGCU6]